MKQVKYNCEVCGVEYYAGKEHKSLKHCRTCAEWLRALNMGPRQKPKESYYELSLVIVYLIKEGKLGLQEDRFIQGLVKGIKR
jgi:hypothetical protein